MAALLHAFQSIPPVVRRRSKELLDVIRDAVKRGLSEAAEGPWEPLVAEPSEATDVSIKTGDDELSAPTPSVSQPPSLWSRDKALPTATTSSLFGTSNLPSRPHLIYSATISSLFGSVPAPRINSHSRFQDVMKKIHNTLVIAPTVSTVRVSCRILLISSLILPLGTS
jgi:exosome complex exonuclease RRP6